MTAEEKITCCFTGHRVLSREELLHINRSLREVVKQRIEEGYSCFAAGGARGFDTAAALTVLEMKRIYLLILIVFRLINGKCIRK